MKDSTLKVIAGLLLADNVVAVEPGWTDYASMLSVLKQSEKHGTRLALVDNTALKKMGRLIKSISRILHFVNSLSCRE